MKTILSTVQLSTSLTIEHQIKLNLRFQAIYDPLQSIKMCTMYTCWALQVNQKIIKPGKQQRPYLLNDFINPPTIDICENDKYSTYT